MYKAADRAGKRAIQAAVVAAHREDVARFVRRALRGRQAHWEEAEQVGRLGVLVGLEKYDPEIAGPDRGRKSFWLFVFPYVRDEIQRWMDHTISWRPRSRNLARDERTAEQREERAAQRRPLSLDETEIALAEASVEELVEGMELLGLLDRFLATLSDADRQLLLCEKRERAEGGVREGNNNRSRRYLSLVERATAFVRGDENGLHSATRIRTKR